MNAEAAAQHDDDAERVGAAHPYAASWLDRLLGWLARLPGPAWLVYLGLFLVGYTVVLTVRWYDISVARDRILIPPPFLVWDVYLLAMVHYLNRQAGQRLAGFRRALDGVRDRDYAEMAYRLTTLPARATVLSGLLWVFIGLTIYLLSPRTFAASGYPQWEIWLTIASYFVGGAAIYHTVHQLREVSRLHAQVRTIDLYQLDPLLLFAGLTMRSALGWVCLLYLTVLSVPPGLLITGLGASWGVVLGLAVAAFVLPLLGMHGRLNVAKQQALRDVNERLKQLVGEVNARIDRRELDGLDAFNKAVGAVLVERDLLAKTSTWPWATGTARGFFTVLLLPVVLRLIQGVLDNQLAGLLR